MDIENPPAGGFATQRGINYQNRVAAYFAVSCVSQSTAIPGLPRSPIRALRCETGEPIADILLTFQNGALAFVEVKRTMQLTASRMKPFLSQLIQQFLISEQDAGGTKFPWRRTLNPDQDRLLLLTSSESSERVGRHLASVLSRINSSVDPSDLFAIPRNAQELAAFEDFHALVLEAWKDLMGSEATLPEVVRLYSLFRIAVLDVGPDEVDEQNAQNILSTAVLNDPNDSAKVWALLVAAMGSESETRRTVDLQILNGFLSDAGFGLISTRAYLRDIRALQEYTRLTLKSLDHLATLSVYGREIRIERPVTNFLRTSALRHSYVVVGDPGAGKSGVLHELATVLQGDHEDVVFLAADRIDDSLKAELNLKYELSEVLTNWRGGKTGTLIIDALDAARGSKAISVLRDLIRDVVSASGSRWRVVASIRVFDLRYSQELQTIFKRPFDETAPKEFQDPIFFNLRHIHVPRFGKEEITRIRQLAPELDSVFDSATPSLRELLAIPFNLRLIAELLSTDVKRFDLSAIETQIGLLGLYWQYRVTKSGSHGTARELVLLDVLKQMVRERRLTISKLKLQTASSSEFGSLCSDDVLVEQAANLRGRYIIGFSHHLLFDYAAARLLLGAEFDEFLKSLELERDLALFLRPSIDLLFKESWLKERDHFWDLLISMSSHNRIPAIARIIGPAVIPELASTNEELAPIIARLTSSDSAQVELGEQWTIHVVGAVLTGLLHSPLSLWSHFAYDLASSQVSLRVSAVCQSLVDNIIERDRDWSANSVQGLLALSRAAILLLDRFLQMGSPDSWIMGRAISNVLDLFWINPAESAIAIRKVITPEEIRKHGAERGHWIARKAPLLFDVDPKLAAEIYVAFFGYEEKSENQTSMGGGRILAMTSNRRQDYHNAQWQLAQNFPRYLERNFDLCGPLVLNIIDSFIEIEEKAKNTNQPIHYYIDGAEHIVQTDYSSIWDGSSVRDEAQNIADAYFRKLVEFAGTDSARAADISKQFLISAKYAYSLRKIVKVAISAPAALMPVIYPLLVSKTALLSYDLSSELGEVLKSGYEHLLDNQKREVEETILRLPEGSDGDIATAKEHYRDRLLGCLPRPLVLLDEVKTRLTKLDTGSGVPENRERYVGGFRAAGPYSMADHLRGEGVPVDEPQNVTIRKFGDELWQFAQRFANSTPGIDEVMQIEETVIACRKLLEEASKNGVHPDVATSVEAELIAACAAAAQCKEVDCSTILGSLIRKQLLSGMLSPFPEPRDDDNERFDKGPSWGAPIQRIEAAEGIGAFLGNETCVDRALIDSARAALRDPVPAVRFQVTRRLLLLHDKHLDLLWSFLDELATSERSTAVLGAALYGVANPLSGRHKAEVVSLVAKVLSRKDLPKDGGDAIEWSYRIATGLFIWQGYAPAYALISPIIDGESFTPRLSAKCLLDIRESLTFSSDVPKPSDREIRKRAFELIDRIALSASGRMELLIHGVPPEARNEDWTEKFQELGRLIDYAGSQLYFASGAYDGTNSSHAAKNLDDNVRRQFWLDSRAPISTLAKIAIPSVAHDLIQTLESFISFAPAEVFHAIAHVVHSAKDWGYQYESLAVELLVKVTERYLAEERLTLQQDKQCRDELIDILDTFVDAGWPSARRLSYRLEEIFR